MNIQTHIDNLKDKVELLQNQGEAIICSTMGMQSQMPIVTVTGRLGDRTLNEVFILDTQPSVEAMTKFTKALTEYSLSLDVPVVEPIQLGGAA